MAQTLLAICGVLFGLTLITALLIRRDDVRRGNRMLAAALACNVGYLIAVVCIRHDWFSGSPIIGFLVTLAVFSPILLLGYVRALIQPGFALRPGDSIHLMPVLSFYLIILVGNGDPAITSNEALQSARGGWPPNLFSLLGILMYSLEMGYLGRALYELQRHRRRAAVEFSYEEGITLRWLRVLVGISAFLAGTGLLIALVRLIPGVDLWPRSLYSMSVVLAVYYLIGLMAMLQPAIFSAETDQSSSITSDRTPQTAGGIEATKYETSALTHEIAAQYWQELQAHMEQEQPFLDSKLRIADLAKQLKMPQHYLSQTINRCGEQSFFEFINRYRVEAAKELLEKGQKSIAGIAFDAGFHSESAFYRHFKKVTGGTPKHFQRRLASQTDS